IPFNRPPVSAARSGSIGFTRFKSTASGSRNLQVAVAALRVRETFESVTHQFLQLIARGGLAGLFLHRRNEHAADELEVFAEIAERLFKDRFRAAVPALVRRARVVAHAVQADPQVGAALRTTFAAPGLSGQRPLPSTF